MGCDSFMAALSHRSIGARRRQGSDPIGMPDQFAWMPASRMTLVQRASSLRIMSPSSFGVLLAGSMPMDSRCLLKSAFATALFISALILSTIGAGVPAGARSPYQVVLLNPGSVSATAGTSGNELPRAKSAGYQNSVS